MPQNTSLNCEGSVKKMLSYLISHQHDNSWKWRLNQDQTMSELLSGSLSSWQFKLMKSKSKSNITFLN